MLLNADYYISHRTSNNYPYPFKDGGVLFVPINITRDEENNVYIFDEYRLRMPITYDIPPIISNVLADSLADFSNKIESIEMPSENGYHYEPLIGSEGITLVLIKDEIAAGNGDYDSPIVYVEGIEAIDGLYYSYEGVIYACIKTTTSANITDRSVFIPC